MIRKESGEPSKQDPIHRESQKTEDESKALPASPQGLFFLKLEAPVREEERPFSSFFINRVLTSFKEKHPESTFQFSKDESGAVVELVLQNVYENQRKSLETALGWSVKRVLENRKRGE